MFAFINKTSSMKFRGSANKKSVNYAIASNTIVLLLIGIFLTLFFHINAITDILKERINVIVELKGDINKNNITSLSDAIAKYEEVLPGSVTYVDKESAVQMMAGDIELSKGQNPFKNVITFNVKSDQYNDETLGKLAKAIKTKDQVYDVYYENVVVDQIKENLKKIAYAILFLSLVFVFLATVIMYNTINLSLYADRFEIKTMEIIGARDGFIRQPYLKLAGSIAIKAFIISAVLLIGLLLLLINGVDGAGYILKWYYIMLVLIILFGFSMLITVISTVSIVNKYLSTELADLYK